MNTSKKIREKFKIKPRVFLFDYDGTIVNSEPYHLLAAQKIALMQGIELSEDYYQKHLLGHDDVYLFQKIFRDKNRRLSKADLDTLLTRKNTEMLQVMQEAVLIDGIKPLVAFLNREKVPTAVVSGARRNEIEYGLKLTGLSDCFSFIVSADDVRSPKPDPEAYELAYEEMLSQVPTLKKSEAWVLEDSPGGVASAVEAGLSVIGITNSVPKDRLNRADLVIEHVNQLEIEL